MKSDFATFGASAYDINRLQRQLLLGIVPIIATFSFNLQQVDMGKAVLCPFPIRLPLVISLDVVYRPFLKHQTRWNEFKIYMVITK